MSNLAVGPASNDYANPFFLFLKNSCAIDLNHVTGLSGVKAKVPHRNYGNAKRKGNAAFCDISWSFATSMSAPRIRRRRLKRVP